MNVSGMSNGINTRKQAMLQSTDKGERKNMQMNLTDGISQQSLEQTCQEPIYGTLAHLAKTSRWPENVPGLVESDHPLYKKFFGSIGKPQKK